MLETESAEVRGCCLVYTIDDETVTNDSNVCVRKC